MSLRDEIVRVAREQIGKPYDTRDSYPWEGPASDYDSFNCSGLTRAVFDECGVTIPGFQRASLGDSQSQWVMDAGNWHWTPADGLQPGDLVFWQDGETWEDTYHVGIYTGGESCVSANGPRMGVCEHDVYIDQGFIGGGWPLSDCDGWDEPRWVKDGDRWWYRHADGSYTKDGWERIDGKWYRFDADGWMQTGWVNDDGKWYYLSEERDHTEGSMVESDVRSIGGKWYAFGPSGEMLYHVDADESGALRL